MKGTVYALCDITHVSLYPWRNDGYKCVAIDIYPHIGGDGVTHICQDIRTIPEDRLFDMHGEPSFIIAFPPCTHFCNSGARWWKEKGQSSVDEGMSIVESCVRIIGQAPGIMENPKGRLGYLYRSHNAVVEPWMFADRSGVEDWYTKETWLWLFNGAIAPKTMTNESWRQCVERFGEYDKRRIHAGRKSDRSNTPKGFAIATWEANKAVIK